MLSAFRRDASNLSISPHNPLYLSLYSNCSAEVLPIVSTDTPIIYYRNRFSQRYNMYDILEGGGEY
jgi:hypothetical protein